MKQSIAHLEQLQYALLFGQRLADHIEIHQYLHSKEHLIAREFKVDHLLEFTFADQIASAAMIVLQIGVRQFRY